MMPSRQKTLIALLGLLAILAGVVALLLTTDQGSSVPIETVAVEQLENSRMDTEVKAYDSVRSESESGAAPASDKATAVLTVNVRSTSGAPVPDATLTLITESTVAAMVRCDAMGQATLRMPAAPGFLAVAQAQGFALEQQSFDAPYPPEITLVLGPEAVISGRVQLADGTPPMVESRVLAWKKGMSVNQAALLAAIAGQPTLPWADCAADGSFSLHGVSPGERYCLVARASGWTSLKRCESTAAGSGEQVVITLVPVYAAIVEAVDARGVLMPPSSFAAMSMARNLRKSSDQELEAASLPDLRLSGLYELSQRQGPKDWRRSVIAYRSHAVGGIEVSVPVRYDIAGFDPVTARIPLRPAGDGVPVVKVYLSGQRTPGFGSVLPALTLDTDLPSGMRHSNPPAVILVLRPADSSERTLRKSWWSALEIEEVHGVPYGEYAAEIATVFTSVPSREPVVVLSERVPVSFDLRNLAWVELVPIESGGAPFQWQGGAGATVRKGNAGWSVGFSEPPYVLQGLPAGIYTVDLELYGVDRHAKGVEVRVTDGGFRRVACEVR